MDTRSSVASGDSIAYGAKQMSEQELLEAAEAALRWFDLFDQHAPSDMIFGGETEVRGLLRDAIRRARAEAKDRTWADAVNPDEAAALDEERGRLGRAPTERERAAFLGGFRAARLEHAKARERSVARAGNRAGVLRGLAPYSCVVRVCIHPPRKLLSRSVL